MKGIKQVAECVSPAALLILGAPFAVFEDDPVLLQCRAKREAALETLRLHKNGKPMRISGKIPDVYIPHASLKDNGAYHCTGVKKDDSPVSSNTVKIQVQGKAYIICEVS